MNARAKPEIDLGVLSQPEREMLERPQRDGDRLAWLDAQKVYISSFGPARVKGAWFIYYEDGAWTSGLVEVENGAYIEIGHATLREAIDRVHA